MRSFAYCECYVGWDGILADANHMAHSELLALTFISPYIDLNKN